MVNMSTICKLNPTIRRARTERRNFYRWATQAAGIGSPWERLVKDVWERLRNLRRQPHNNAVTISERFARILGFYAKRRSELAS